MFVRGNERWTAKVAGNPTPIHYDALTQTVSVTALDRDNVYFIAPGKTIYQYIAYIVHTVNSELHHLLYVIFIADRFLGDQRASYNQDLTFTLRIGETGPAPTARDIILEGGNGEQITQPIFGQNNRIPTVVVSLLPILSIL